MIQQRVCCVETNLLLLQICYCLLVTNIGSTNVISNVMRRTKGSATKALASCPNITSFITIAWVMQIQWIITQLLPDSIMKVSIAMLQNVS